MFYINKDEKSQKEILRDKFALELSDHVVN